MPQTISIDPKRVIIKKGTFAILNLYEQCTQQLSTEKKAALGISLEKIAKEGFISKAKAQLEVISGDKKGGSECVFTSLQCNLSDFAVELREAYLLFLNTLIETVKKSSKDTANNVIESRYVLTYEILVRLVTVALSNEENTKRSGDKLIEVLELFVYGILANQGLDNQQQFRFLLSQEQADWKGNFKQAIKIIQLINLPENSFTAIINYLSRVKMATQTYILAQCNSLTSADDVCDQWINTTYRRFLGQNDRLDLTDGAKVSLTLNSIQENKLATLKKNMTQDRVRALFLLLNETEVLYEMITKVESIVKASGWVLLLMGKLRFGALVEYIQKHKVRCDTLLDFGKSGLDNKSRACDILMTHRRIWGKEITAEVPEICDKLVQLGSINNHRMIIRKFAEDVSALLVYEKVLEIQFIHEASIQGFNQVDENQKPQQKSASSVLGMLDREKASLPILGQSQPHDYSVVLSNQTRHDSRASPPDIIEQKGSILDSFSLVHGVIDEYKVQTDIEENLSLSIIENSHHSLEKTVPVCSNSKREIIIVSEKQLTPELDSSVQNSVIGTQINYNPFSAPIVSTPVIETTRRLLPSSPSILQKREKENNEKLFNIKSGLQQGPPNLAHTAPATQVIDVKVSNDSREKVNEISEENKQSATTTWRNTMAQQKFDNDLPLLETSDETSNDTEISSKENSQSPQLIINAMNNPTDEVTWSSKANAYTRYLQTFFQEYEDVDFQEQFLPIQKQFFEQQTTMGGKGNKGPISSSQESSLDVFNDTDNFLDLFKRDSTFNTAADFCREVRRIVLRFEAKRMDVEKPNSVLFRAFDLDDLWECRHIELIYFKYLCVRTAQTMGDERNLKAFIKQFIKKAETTLDSDYNVLVSDLQQLLKKVTERRLTLRKHLAMALPEQQAAEITQLKIANTQLEKQVTVLQKEKIVLIKEKVEVETKYLAVKDERNKLQKNYDQQVKVNWQKNMEIDKFKKTVTQQNEKIANYDQKLTNQGKEHTEELANQRKELANQRKEHTEEIQKLREEMRSNRSERENTHSSSQSFSTHTPPSTESHTNYHPPVFQEARAPRRRPAATPINNRQETANQTLPVEKNTCTVL